MKTRTAVGAGSCFVIIILLNTLKFNIFKFRRLLMKVFFNHERRNISVYRKAFNRPDSFIAQKKEHGKNHALIKNDLLKFSLACSLRLLLTSNAGLLVMLSLADLLLDTCLSTITLESAKSAVQWLVFFYDNVWHNLTPNLPPVVNLCQINCLGNLNSTKLIIP